MTMPKTNVQKNHELTDKCLELIEEEEGWFCPRKELNSIIRSWLEEKCNQLVHEILREENEYKQHKAFKACLGLAPFTEPTEKPEWYYKDKNGTTYNSKYDCEASCWHCGKTFMTDPCDATCRLCGAPFDKTRCGEFNFKPDRQPFTEPSGEKVWCSHIYNGGHCWYIKANKETGIEMGDEVFCGLNNSKKKFCPICGTPRPEQSPKEEEPPCVKYGCPEHSKPYQSIFGIAGEYLPSGCSIKQHKDGKWYKQTTQEPEQEQKECCQCGCGCTLEKGHPGFCNYKKDKEELEELKQPEQRKEVPEKEERIDKLAAKLKPTCFMSLEEKYKEIARILISETGE